MRQYEAKISWEQIIIVYRICSDDTLVLRVMQEQRLSYQFIFVTLIGATQFSGSDIVLFRWVDYRTFSSVC